MKSFLFMLSLILGVFTWRAGERLSSDAVAVIVGIFFAAMLFIPIMFLLFSFLSHLRDQAHQREMEYQRIVANQLDRPRVQFNFVGSTPQRLPDYSGYSTTTRKLADSGSNRHFYDRSDGRDRLLEVDDDEVDDDDEGSFVIEDDEFD